MSFDRRPSVPFITTVSESLSWRNTLIQSSKTNGEARQNQFESLTPLFLALSLKVDELARSCDKYGEAIKRYDEIIKPVAAKSQRNVGSEADDVLNVYHVFDEMPHNQTRVYNEELEDNFHICQLFDEMSLNHIEDCGKVCDVLDILEADSYDISQLFEEMPQGEIKKYDNVYDISQLFDEIPQREIKKYEEFYIVYHLLDEMLVKEMDSDNSRSNLVDDEFERNTDYNDRGKLLACMHLFDPGGCVVKDHVSFFDNIAYLEYLNVGDVLGFTLVEKCVNVADSLDIYSLFDEFCESEALDVTSEIQEENVHEACELLEEMLQISTKLHFVKQHESSLEHVRFAKLMYLELEEKLMSVDAYCCEWLIGVWSWFAILESLINGSAKLFNPLSSKWLLKKDHWNLGSYWGACIGWLVAKPRDFSRINSLFSNDMSYIWGYFERGKDIIVIYGIIMVVNSRQQTKRVPTKKHMKPEFKRQMCWVVNQEGLEQLYGGSVLSLADISTSQGVRYYFYETPRNKAEVINRTSGVDDGLVGILLQSTIAALFRAYKHTPRFSSLYDKEFNVVVVSKRRRDVIVVYVMLVEAICRPKINGPFLECEVVDVYEARLLIEEEIQLANMEKECKKLNTTTFEVAKFLLNGWISKLLIEDMDVVLCDLNRPLKMDCKLDLFTFNANEGVDGSVSKDQRGTTLSHM